MITDEEVEDFIEHFGKKGMKWGVRNQRRLDIARRVSKGTGSMSDSIRSFGRQSVISLIRGKGLRGAAARDVLKLQAAKARIKTGKATTRDLINKRGWMTVGATH
jgi:hypothetical protein